MSLSRLTAPYSCKGSIVTTLTFRSTSFGQSIKTSLRIGKIFTDLRVGQSWNVKSSACFEFMLTLSKWAKESFNGTIGTELLSPTKLYTFSTFIKGNLLRISCKVVYLSIKSTESSSSCCKAFLCNPSDFKLCSLEFRMQILFVNSPTIWIK